jgi:hypothetical protein
MSAAKLSFHLELTDQEVPQLINCNIYDSDHHTILGQITDYDKDTCLATASLTEEGIKILSNSKQPAIDEHSTKDYLSKETAEEFTNIFQFTNNN